MQPVIQHEYQWFDILGTKESLSFDCNGNSLDNLAIKELWLVKLQAVVWFQLLLFLFVCLFDSTNSEASQRQRNSKAKHMHLAKSPQPYSMSTPACSFVLSEITGTAGNRDEKKNKSDEGAVLSSRLWRTTLFYKPTHLHQTHSPCSSACLPLSLRLLASLHLSLLSSTPLPPRLPPSLLTCCS